MIAIIPAFVALAGLVVYLAATNPKAAEMGRLAYGAGLLVTLWQLAGRAVRLF